MGEVGATGWAALTPSGPKEQRETGINRSEPASERVAPAQAGVGGRAGPAPRPPRPPATPDVKRGETRPARRHSPPTPSPRGAIRGQSTASRKMTEKNA